MTLEDEIKSLEAIRDAARQWPGEVVSTLLAAHVVPQEYAGKADDYVKEVCDEMIPLVAKKKLAKYVDVFCDRGAFTQEQSEKVLAAARKHGLGTRAHVCQFTAAKLKPLLEYQPASFDHMDSSSRKIFLCWHKERLWRSCCREQIIFLAIKSFPMRDGLSMRVCRWRWHGLQSRHFTHPEHAVCDLLACTHMKMTPAEAIAAATINAACALRMQERKGSLEPGKDADLAVFDVKDYREIAYWFALDRLLLKWWWRGELWDWIRT